MLSNHFQINHTMTMSSIVPSGYKFGATYIGSNQIGPGEVKNKTFFVSMYFLFYHLIFYFQVYPLILGDMDSTGNLNANIIHQFHPNVRTRVVAQVKCEIFKSLKNLTYSQIKLFHSFFLRYRKTF